MNNHEVSIVLTACDRLDLLERTIESFLRFNTYPIKELLIRDDSGVEKIKWDMDEELQNLNLPFPFKSLSNAQIGQATSIDRLMDEVKTPYVFHLEDDWEFYQAGFIEKCLAVISDDVAQVWVRSHSDGSAAIIGKEGEVGGVKYNYVQNHFFSFNPHLRKVSALTFTGKNETTLGKWVTENNLRTIWLQDGFCRHIGGSKPTNRAGTPYQHGVKKA